MAVTLAQAKNLVQDKLSEFIVDEFRQSPLMDMMIFDNVVSPQGSGSSLSYVYNRVTTLPTADFRELNNEYTPHEAATTQEVVNLKIFGGSFQLDRVIQRDMQGIVSELEFQLQQKIKAARALFEDTFINGDSAVDASAFDGLDKALTGSTTEFTPTAPIDLSTAANIDSNWKELVKNLDDMIEELDETPSMLLMSKKMYATMRSVANISTSFTTTKDNFGRAVLSYDGIPLVKMGDKPGTSNPIIPTGLGTDGTTTGTTSIYAVRVGLDGVHAVTPKGDKIIHEYLPNFQLPDAVKKGEVEMVAAMVMKATRSAGVLRDIKIA